MAIAVVQSLAVATANAVGSLQSSAFGSSPATGNTIIVAIISYFPVASVTDTAGNTYVRDIHGGDNGGDANRDISIWRSTNITGGSNFKITVAPASGGFYATFGAIEVSGLDNSSTADGAGSTNGAASSTTATTGAFSTTNADDLIVAAVGSAQLNGQNYSAKPSGYTQFANQELSSTVQLNAQYRIVSAVQTSVNLQWTQSLDTFAAAVFAYKASAAAGNPWYYFAQQAICAGGM